MALPFPAFSTPADATYLITNEDGDEFDSATPWECPGPDSDNSVGQPTLGLPAGATTIVVSWKAPPELEVVFGYKVTIYESSALDDYEEKTIPSGWNGKVCVSLPAVQCLYMLVAPSPGRHAATSGGHPSYHALPC